MARHVALAVDLGASGGRVVAGGFDGRLLELEEVHRFDNGPVTMAGRLIWDLPRLWQEVSLGLRAAAARHAQKERMDSSKERACPLIFSISAVW